MYTYEFNKVIRDKILGAMLTEGCEVEYRKLDGIERREKLIEKLMEEAEEVKTAVDKENFLEELADVQLVLDALLEDLDEQDKANFKNIHDSKLGQKGGFSDGIWVEKVSVPKDNPWIKYFEDRPDKYPRIN